MTKKKITVAFVAYHDPFKSLSWSGATKSILETLNKIGCKIIIIGPLRSNLIRFFYILKRVYFNFFHIKYESDRNIFLSKYYSKKIKKKIGNQKIDAIITSDTFLVSFLETKTPIFIWNDTSYKDWVYKYFKNDFTIHQKSFQQADLLEKKAFDRAKNVIFTSQESARRTKDLYSGLNKKIKIINFGANVAATSIKKQLVSKISKGNICKLITIGVEWKRKGIDRAINIVKILNRIGVQAELTIISKSFRKIKENYIYQTGFLNKDNKQDKLRFQKKFREADFLILMSKAEAFGIVISEAGYYGVPSIVSNIGGLKSIVQNNVNGLKFSLKEKDKNIAITIKKIFINKKKLYKLKKNTLKNYKKNLSWDVAGEKIKKLLLNK